ncbi:ribosomal protein S5 domain 2-like protein [Obba rivulosa]|uniref:Ribosomal protein S5 domain 2-like protein n=1 Tax=Obba rivulosa TaxID=1052685 RepID=A0A8E2AT84_9APHY|nr:ribosomal protein S5 domain 2-like protein [Obba rivulosa]
MAKSSHAHTADSGTLRPKATSQEIRDRSSIFIANIFEAATPEDARKAVEHMNRVHASKPAYEIAAWRCMVVKPGKSGLGGPDDFELRFGSDDGGERYAGGRVLRVMQAEGVLDAVVVVSRWYGGIMLGPARFTHIETCTREVCHAFLLQEEVETCVSTLRSLDDILATLRSELAELTPATAPDSSDNAGHEISVAMSRKPPDYASLQQSLDLVKGKRLVTARENAIKSVKIALKRVKDKANIDHAEGASSKDR